MEYLKYLPGVVGVAILTAAVSNIDWYVNPIMARRGTEPQEGVSELEEHAYVIAGDSGMQGYDSSGLAVKALGQE